MINKNFKKLIFKCFLGAEIIAFSFTYLLGKNGIYQLNQLYNQNEQEKSNINNIKNEIEEINKQINLWNTDTFYKEQVARETLQMACKNDKIFYID